MALGVGEVAKITAKIVVDTKDFNKGLKEADSNTAKFSHSLKTGLKVAAAGAAVAVTAVVGVIGESIKKAAEAQISQAKLAKAVENSGVSWKKHGKEIEDWLDKTTLATTFAKGDLSDAMTKLVTTTGNATKAQKLLKDAMDISAASGKPLTATTLLVQKAYNGSSTALSRMGVVLPKVTAAQDALKASHKDYTAAQMAAAKATDFRVQRESNLAVIHAKFGGQAAAQAQTLTGMETRMGHAVDLVEEKLGKKFIPIITSVLSWVLKFSQSKEFNQWMADAQNAVETAWHYIKMAWDGVTKVFRDNQKDIIGTLHALKTIFSDTFHALKPILVDVFHTVTKVIKDALRAIGDLIHIAMDLIQGHWGKAWTDIKNFVGDVFDGIKDLLHGEINILGDIAKKIGSAIWHGFTGVLGNIGGWIKTHVVSAFNSGLRTIAGYVNDLISIYDKIPFVPHIDKVSWGSGGGGGGGQGRGAIPTAVGGMLPSTSGGTYLPHLNALAGEAGYDEAIITTDPRHKKRSYALIAEVARRIESGGTHGRAVLPGQNVPGAGVRPPQFAGGGIAGGAGVSKLTSGMGAPPGGLGSVWGSYASGIWHALEHAVTAEAEQKFHDVIGFFTGSNMGQIGKIQNVANAYRTAVAKSRLGLPYLWGDGHGSSFASLGQAVDCSGGVSEMLGAAGQLSHPEVSGDLASWGSPGAGGMINVYANPTHTFMNFGGKAGFGTSNSNPGGGWGDIPYTSQPGFTARHYAGGGIATGDYSGGVPVGKIGNSWDFTSKGVTGNMRQRMVRALAHAKRHYHKLLAHANSLKGSAKTKAINAAHKWYHNAIVAAQRADNQSHRRAASNAAAVAYYQRVQNDDATWMTLEQGSQDPNMDANVLAMMQRQLRFDLGARASGYNIPGLSNDISTLYNDIASQKATILGNTSNTSSADYQTAYQALAGYVSQFAGNISPLGQNKVTVVQHISMTDPDPHSVMRRASFAAQAAF